MGALDELGEVGGFAGGFDEAVLEELFRGGSLRGVSAREQKGSCKKGGKAHVVRVFGQA